MRVVLKGLAPATRLAVSGICLFSVSCIALADDPPSPLPPPTDAPIEFRLAGDVLPQGEVTLANGVEVNTADWQTLILATIPKPAVDPAKAPTCTGTLVGPTVVLLAAHCVDNPLGLGPRKAQLNVEGRQAAMGCEIHPAYLAREPKFRGPRGSEDFALCYLDFNGSIPQSISRLRFDLIDASAQLPAQAKVLMTGYGCSDLRVVDNELDWDKSDRLLRIGDARITTPASAPSNAGYVLIRSENAKGPAVCPGDSGGPLFSHATVASPDGARRIVGVNSAIALDKRPDGKFDLISSISALGASGFANWATTWAQRHQANARVVCGITHAAGRTPCRD